MNGTDIQIQQVKFLKDFKADLIMVKNNQEIDL